MSIDFDWQENEDAFSNRPEPAEVHLAPAPAPRHRRTRARTEGRGRLGKLALLLAGILAGMGLGFVMLSAQGQRGARADLTPMAALQQQAITAQDADLLRSLIDPEDSIWRDLPDGRLFATGVLSDAGAPTPGVGRVKVQGDFAEFEIVSKYAGNEYRRLETARRTADGWRLTRATLSGWGELTEIRGKDVVLHYYPRDAFVRGYLPKIEAVVQAFCGRYQSPDPCQVDLTITPDLKLRPFIPADGADAPPNIDYDSVWEGQREEAMAVLNGPGTKVGISKNEKGTEVVYGDSSEFVLAAIPVQVLSPRLVGLDGRQAHPLWWLTLYEAIGDAIMRRSMGVVVAPVDVAHTTWAIGRGDVALWAERYSGATLSPKSSPMLAEHPVAVGAALLAGDWQARKQSKDLAQYLHKRFGEVAVVQFIRQAHEADAAELFALLGGLGPDQLAKDWAAWESSARG